MNGVEKHNVLSARDYPHSLIYRLNLDVVGGAEICFSQYAAYRRTQTVTDTVIVGSSVNPRFASVVESPFIVVPRDRLRRWHGLRLPRAVKSLRARNAVAKTVRGNETALLGWNTIGNREIVDIALRAQLPLLHYEHGQAWRSQRRHAHTYLCHVQGVISNSRAAERMLTLRWGWSGPTVRVYCAIDGVLPVRAARAGVAREGQLWLGIAGRLTELKGHRIALHTIKALRDIYKLDVCLAIAGTGEDETALRDEAGRLGLTSVVRFEGAVSDMAAFYDAMDLMVVPSLRESFGRISIEAQSRGCPVIATGTDGLPETVPPEVHDVALVRPTWSLAEYARELGGNADIGAPYVYDPQSDGLLAPRAPAPSHFAAAVAALIESDVRYQQASRAGLAHVNKRFALSDYGPAMDRAIMKLAGYAG